MALAPTSGTTLARRPRGARRTSVEATIHASSAARPRGSRGWCGTASTCRTRSCCPPRRSSTPCGTSRRGASRAPCCAWRRDGPATPRAAEALQQILQRALPRGLAEELRVLWREVGPRSRGGSRCARARRARTARSSPWPASPRACSACAAVTPWPRRCAQVWASLASGRALAYLAAHGVRDVGMAVVIQRMVEATRGGRDVHARPGARSRGTPAATSASSTPGSASGRPSSTA